jgi:hypothetical protein
LGTSNTESPPEPVVIIVLHVELILTGKLIYKRRECRIMGHLMRGEGMKNLVTTGKIQGKRDR